MTLRLFNTLTGQLDELAPADGKALRMYACGPTVYDYGHIGNFRTFLEIDVLRRLLQLTGMPVHHVMNITDVDDKIIRNAAEAGIPIGEYTAPFEEAFLEDLDACRSSGRSRLRAPPSTFHKMVELIQKLAASRRSLPDRRRDLVLQAGSISRVRQAEQERSERDGRRRARGRGRVREGLGARLCAVEGGQAGRDVVGYGDRPRPAGLAH